MKKRTTFLLVAGALVLGSTTFANADTLTVSAATVNGSRTLAVLGSVGGTDISSLSLGAGDTAPFATTVTDVAYGHVGFDVTTRMSRLYETDATQANGYDCTTYIDSKALSISFADVPTSQDVAALVAPVFDLDGTVSLTDGTSLAVTAVEHAAESLYTYTVDLANDAAPIQVTDLADGAPDWFTNRAAFEPCSDAGSTDGSGTSNVTDVLVNQGTPNATLGTLFDTIESDIRKTGDTAANGTANTVGEYVNAGILDLAAVKRTLASALGVDAGLLTDASVQALSATLHQISDLAGQNGVYVSMPILNLNRNDASAEAAPTGVYKGQMTVTIADTP